MSRQRERAKRHEAENGTRIKCDISRFRCIYCPIAFIGKCARLERFLEKGKWE